MACLHQRTFKLLNALLLGTTFCGCASVSSLNQRVKVDADASEAQIYQDNQLVGTAPGFIELRRRSSLNLLAKTKTGDEQPLPVPTSFRWSETLGGNLVLAFCTGGITMYPLWIGIDAITGAMWNYQKNLKVDFKNITPPPYRKAKVIAIAPPEANHELLSDEVGEELFLLTKQKFPKSLVYRFQNSKPLFTEYNYTFNHEVEPNLRDPMYFELGATHVLESRVTENKDSTVVQSKLVDVFDETPTLLFTSQVQTKKLSYGDTGLWTRSKSFLFELIPNSIGFTYGQKTAFAYVWGEETAGESYWIPPANEAPRFSLTGSNVRSYKTRSPFAFTARWASQVSVEKDSYRMVPYNYQVGSPTTLPYIKIDWWKFGFGIGPELGLEFPFGYFYLQLIPELQYNVLDAKIDERKDKYGTGFLVPITASIGYNFFISDPLSVRIFVSATQIPSDQTGKMFSEATDSNMSFNSGRFFIGLSMEYYLPSIRSMSKDLVNQAL